MIVDEQTVEETQPPAPAAAESADTTGTVPPQETESTETKADAEAPATTDAEAPATDDAAKEESADKADPSEDAEKKKNRVTARERIAELTRERREAEREAAALRARLSKYEDTAKTPDPANYDDLDQFETDRTVAAVSKVRKAEIEDDVTVADKRANDARSEMWNAKVADFAHDIPDFADVAYSVPLSDAMAETIPDLDNGPAVAYYLGQHRVEAAEISQLSERETAIALGRIEGRLHQQQIPARRVSAAPEPLQTVSGKTPTPPTPDLNRMSMKDYASHRNKEMEKAKG